ncbi:MAG TPA: LysR family transcriptional regulator ArgP [Frankiaceae bacterium]|nr:LysR family transcriptional regulator ArgP [Frankiaceae bacterium]
MDFELSQLAALSAAVSEGTLEGAARALHITPSAVSQRLKALEQAAGRVLLVRSKPVRVTPSGEPVLRLARQVALLTADAHRELGRDGDAVGDSAGAPSTIPLAINADSLATWVLDALAPLADSLRFDIYREDQAHTSALLREGTAMAAITSDAAPVPGCSSSPLGSMRYRCMAAPEFASRWFGDGVSAAALAVAPVVVFDRKDDLQHRYLRRRSRRPLRPPSHFVPSSADFLTAVRLSFGWGMVPDLQAAQYESAGALVDLDPAGASRIELHWQQWKLRSPSLDLVAGAIRAAARERLDQRTRRRAVPANGR